MSDDEAASKITEEVYALGDPALLIHQKNLSATSERRRMRKAPLIFPGFWGF